MIESIPAIVDKCYYEHFSCSYMKTGVIPIYQKIFFCLDCNPTMIETYCEHCATKCHYGHHTVKSKKLKTICFCGRRLHQIPQLDAVADKTCSFWEFDDSLGSLTKKLYFNKCKKCKKYFCSFCVYFCHYHHIDHIIKDTNIKKALPCPCSNDCHKDNRMLFYYLKDFSLFRLEGLETTHMTNMLMECSNTSVKLFERYSIDLQELQAMIESNAFKWDRNLVNSSAHFPRALMCLSSAMANIKMCYFSIDTRERLFPLNVILEVCANNELDEKYDMKLIKKNLLVILLKTYIQQDFEKYPRYNSRDYANISCLQRLILYSAVRNDPTIRRLYLETLNFRMSIIKLFEKYANQCRIDDHMSMSLFAIMIRIVKILMQYGAFNTSQIKMINDIIELLFKYLKLEKIPPGNEEYKENIFKYVPSLLYIMIYTYNDYVFLENFLYNKIILNEFSLGRSNFGSKIISSVFMANLRYLLKFINSKSFPKIMSLTIKTLALLTGENDHYLKTLFSLEKYELYDFALYHGTSDLESKYHHNYAFYNKPGDEIYVLGIPKFFNWKLTSTGFYARMDDTARTKRDIEEFYVSYFTMELSAQDLINNVVLKLKEFNPIIGAGEENPPPVGAITEIVKLMEKYNNYKEMSKTVFKDCFLCSNSQLILNKTGFMFTILKILKICYLQEQLITEDVFNTVMTLVNTYTERSLSNTINILSYTYLQYLLLYTYKFPHIIFGFIYKRLKFLKEFNFVLSDYSPLFHLLKDSYNFTSKSPFNDNPENFINGYIFHLKCLKILKRHLPPANVDEMKMKIKEFLDKLWKEDMDVKEFFWINSMKHKILLIDENTGDGKKSEGKKSSKVDKNITGIISDDPSISKGKKDEVKSEPPEINNINDEIIDQGLQPFPGEDILGVFSVKDNANKKPEAGSHRDIEEIDKNNNNSNNPSINADQNDNDKDKEKNIDLDNDKVKSDLSISEINLIDESNFDNSMIKMEEDIHQQLAGNPENNLSNSIEIKALDASQNEISINQPSSDLKATDIVEKEEEKLEKQNIEDAKAKERVNQDLSKIKSNSLKKNKALENKDSEAKKTRKIKDAEYEWKMNEKLLSVPNVKTAFIKWLQFINLYSEDLANPELQNSMKKYFPRDDIAVYLQQKKSIEDLALRASLLVLVRNAFLNTPISKDDGHVQEVHLNTIQIEREKKNAHDVARVANILLYEIINFIEILAPSFDINEQFRNLTNEEKQCQMYSHLKKNIEIFLNDLVKSIKILADTVYVLGNRISGEVLCEAYQMFYNFMQRKNLIENLIQGKSLDEAVQLNNEFCEKAKKNPLKKIDELFSDDNGGVENFNSKEILKIFYPYIMETVKIAFPNIKKGVSDVWYSLNQRINNVGSANSLDCLPSMIENVSQWRLSRDEEHEHQVLKEYSNICKLYLDQSQNFRQSPLLSIFNCMVHESDFNYRELFVKVFFLSFIKGELRDMEDNCLLQIMNKALEYDYEALHPFIMKYTIDIKLVLGNDLYQQLVKVKGKRQKQADVNFIMYNELNKILMYNMMIQFAYANRMESYNVFENAAFISYHIFKFYQLLAKNPTCNLHDYILKTFHKLGRCDVNIFSLIEALLEKVITLSKWGLDNDQKNPVHTDSLYIMFQSIIYCLADYAREADEDGVVVLFDRIKPVLHAFKRILFSEKYKNSKDLIFELKLSIIHLLISFLEEGKAGKILNELALNFDPFKMFKLCVYIFKVFIKEIVDKGLYSQDLSVKKPKQNQAEFYELSLAKNFDELLKLRKKDDIFTSSILITICMKIFSYLRILREVYKEKISTKCLYAIKRFKNTWKGPAINNANPNRTLTDYKFLVETESLVETFLERDEITETEYFVYKYLKLGIGCVEIFTYRNKHEYVYFPYLPVTFYLRPESLERFTDNFYEREFSYKKIEELSMYTNQALEECFYAHHLNQGHKVVGIVDKASNFFLYKIVVCAVNAFICSLTWAAGDIPNFKTLTTLSVAFDIINFCYMALLIILWFTIRFFPRFKHIKFKYQIERKIPTEKALSVSQTLRIIIWDIFICDFDFLYVGSTMTMCFFSLIYRNYFSLKFFQMLNFLILSSDLFRIIKFIVKHWFEFALMFFMLFLFLLSTTSFSKDFFSELPTNPRLKLTSSDTSFLCNSTFSNCLFLWIFFGLRSSDGISSIMANTFTDYDAQMYWKRLILDVGVDVVVKGLWLTLLISQVIVGFFDYAKSKERLRKDVETSCFVCHLDKDVFLKHKVNFDKHVKNEHKVTNYIFYLMYILTKNQGNMAKIDEYVLDKFRMNNLLWIPSQDTQSIKERMDAIRERQTLITSQFK